METKSSNQQRRFRQLCNFCGGDHWNDNCPAYATVYERKQVLKRLCSCFICLKRGHRAFECFTQKTCFFCKRENYHHRSLCHQNIDSIENIKLQSIQNNPNNEQLSEEVETLCYKTHSSVSEYKQILNELYRTKSDLRVSAPNMWQTKLIFTVSPVALAIYFPLKYSSVLHLFCNLYVL